MRGAARPPSGSNYPCSAPGTSFTSPLPAPAGGRLILAYQRLRQEGARDTQLRPQCSLAEESQCRRWVRTPVGAEDLWSPCLLSAARTLSGSSPLKVPPEAFPEARALQNLQSPGPLGSMLRRDIGQRVACQPLQLPVPCPWGRLSPPRPPPGPCNTGLSRGSASPLMCTTG